MKYKKKNIRFATKNQSVVPVVLYENAGEVIGICDVLRDPPAFAAVFAPVRWSKSDSLLERYAGSLYMPGS